MSGVCSPSEANYCSNPFEVFYSQFTYFANLLLDDPAANYFEYYSSTHISWHYLIHEVNIATYLWFTICESLYIKNLCIIHSRYLYQFKPSQNRDITFGFVYHFSTMTWFSDSLEIMSTNLFWTLFLLLLGIIIVEIFLLYHKLDPWITYWIMRSDTRKQLMDLEDRYTYTKKDSSIISINNWGKLYSCHFSQDISK